MKGMIFNNYGVVVRESPDMNSKVLGELECFDVVKLLEENPEWSKIRKDKLTGYIKTEFVTRIVEGK